MVPGDTGFNLRDFESFCDVLSQRDGNMEGINLKRRTIRVNILARPSYQLTKLTCSRVRADIAAELTSRLRCLNENTTNFNIKQAFRCSITLFLKTNSHSAILMSSILVPGRLFFTEHLRKLTNRIQRPTRSVFRMLHIIEALPINKGKTRTAQLRIIPSQQREMCNDLQLQQPLKTDTFSYLSTDELKFQIKVVESNDF
ncbi:hypothetical protein TcasGA2_TC007109 [Tribolium castaneum]|uniref:Uncharacterized protein n=1 Tax=Tribolium castaneum TaxID=7070 RepID=D2A1D3_TRICA|nr:hypothetical protein TcasGA2_TC007109 [Tribolium castaneum]